MAREDQCSVKGCDTERDMGAWIEYGHSCERTLPREQGHPYENVTFRLPLCDRHYRLLYIQSGRFPDTVSMPA